MKADVVIVGGGPGGAATAMYLLRRGIRPLIIEKEVFPRYHIGESMTGECALIIRDLGLEEKMRTHPEKQGVKVYGNSKRGTWWVPIMARVNGDLKDINSWQVRRQDFDTMILQEAVNRGADLIRGKAVKPLVRDDGSVYGVTVEPADGGTFDIHSELLLDCSGQATFLANSGITGPKYLGNYDKQIAIFSQVSDALRDNGDTRELHKDNTIIFYQKKFHWSWFIPLNEEVVSIGVVSPAAYFLEKKETKRDFLIRELHELNPEIKRRIPEINLVEDVHVIPNYSFQVKRFSGKGFICIGDAHRFVDPIFSFGLWISMKEAKYCAPFVQAYLEGKNRDSETPFGDYEIFCEKGADVLEDLIDTFWEQPMTFALFVHHRHRPEMIDIFSGRAYENRPSKGVEALRQTLQREREYGAEDQYSIPIGSRYHPERQTLWEPNSPVDCTEEWMGPR